MTQHLEGSALDARGLEAEEAVVPDSSSEHFPGKDLSEVGKRLSTASTAAGSDSEGEPMFDSDSAPLATSKKAGSARGQRLGARCGIALGMQRKERARWSSEGAIGPHAPALPPVHGRGARRRKTVSFGSSSLVDAEVFPYDSALGGSDEDGPAPGSGPRLGPGGGAPPREEAAREEAEDVAQGQADMERLQALVDRIEALKALGRVGEALAGGPAGRRGLVAHWLEAVAQARARRGRPISMSRQPAGSRKPGMGRPRYGPAGRS
ncbi:unnamed protein product [Prorocentrum cordatum]|uniref:Uncharacterized protein n=1 Tax=Prorocentrum cordatum TaxID=2364126 RepID=A0ABN9PM50_9DINO|nr:unnamed protein product [Polarella glacialis]